MIRGLKSIALAVMKTGSLLVLTKAVGFIAQISLASKLGVTSVSDAYFMVLILPTFMCNVMGGAVGISTAKNLEDDRSGGMGLAIIAKMFMYLIIPLLALVIFREKFANVFFSANTDLEKIISFNTMSLFFWPLTSIMCVSQIILVWINSRGHIFLCSTTPLIYSIIILIFVYFKNDQSVSDLLIYSQCTSVILEVAVLIYFSHKFKILLFNPSFFSYFKNFPLITPGLISTSFSWALLSFSAPIEQFFAARNGLGVNTIIGLTNRLVIPFCSLTSSVVAIVLLQKFVKTFGVHSNKIYWSYYLKLSIYIALFALCISFFSYYFSTQIINAAYGGINFSDKNRENIQDLFNLAVFLLPAQVLIALSFRVFAITNNSNIQLTLVFLSLLVQLACNFFVPKSSLGNSIIFSTLAANYFLAISYFLYGFKLCRN
jgi:peptidoglycan biosynthesis protein MviN/MurJ (putative lipid II flippase)